MDWAGLPGDLLTSVGALLAVPGRICFRAVCRAWRAAIKEEEAAPMPAPWVVIPRTAGFTDSFTVLSAPTMNLFQWTPSGCVRARCVGSSGSWLAIATALDVRSIAMSLVNPLTDARVELPLVTVEDFVWLFNPDPRKVEFGMAMVVQKVAFSPSPSAQDYAAAYVSDCTKSVLCARAGTDGWLLLPELPGGICEWRELDVAYHDGKFYYMATSGQVWVVDMAAPSPSPVPLAVLKPPLRRMNYMERGFHLAFSGDGALHVVWSLNDGRGCITAHITTDNCPDMLMTCYDPASGFFSPWTTPVTSLAGRAFLIGDRNQSMSVPVDGSSSASWLRPDSVYFTNIPLCDLYATRSAGRRGLWAFDLVTGRIACPRAENEILERQLESELDVDWDKSLWLMPCLT